MRFSLRKLRSYSDERLVNVVIYRERYGYPFDYVEACKDELRTRGYSSADLQQVITEAGEGAMPKRFALRKRIETAGKILLWLPGIALVLFAALFVWSDMWSEALRRTVGGSAVLLLCLSFLVYTYRTVLRGNLARFDSDSSDNSPFSS